MATSLKEIKIGNKDQGYALPCGFVLATNLFTTYSDHLGRLIERVANILPNSLTTLILGMSPPLHLSYIFSIRPIRISSLPL